MQGWAVVIVMKGADGAGGVGGGRGVSIHIAANEHRHELSAVRLMTTGAQRNRIHKTAQLNTTSSGQIFHTCVSQATYIRQILAYWLLTP